MHDHLADVGLIFVCGCLAAAAFGFVALILAVVFGLTLKGIGSVMK